MILLFNPWRFSPTLHYKKQNLGLMVNGLATITYDKTTIDTSNSVTNATSQSTTLEGHYADFDVYQYDYSGQTTTDSQTSHEFTQVAFDSTATTHWSLVSYTSIQTVGTGLSYAEESVFDMWQHITTTGDYSVNTWIYEHSRERDHSGSSHLTTTYETHGHSVADWSGGYEVQLLDVPEWPWINPHFSLDTLSIVPFLGIRTDNLINRQKTDQSVRQDASGYALCHHIAVYQRSGQGVAV